MPKNKPRRPSIQTVADTAGVSRATVSMALNGRPGVNEGTRERVRRVAKELGYFVHPVLAGLGASSFRQSDLVKGAVLMRSKYHLDAMEGQATALTEAGRPFGFVFEGVDSTRFDSPKALTRFLFDRGFLAIFLSYVSWDVGFLAGLEWSRFAGVQFTGEPMQPEFHLVRVGHTRVSMEACETLLQTGARRIGPLLMRPSANRPDFQKHAAAVNWKLREEKPGRAVSTCYIDDFRESEKNRKTIHQWMAKERPDAIVAFNPGLAHFVIEASPRFPRERIVLLAGAGPFFPGFASGFPSVAHQSVQLLNTLCRGSQFGPPSRPMELLVTPEWHAPAKFAD